ncbi:hypothetical protein SKAU_G00008560 [Synaphobranchus kaupii]|uniref:long-chain-fatty-acid--CoA ligase n=1 Tax=Synaphobranchus kaupii TaxID=118154 RepID=A0A9Q1GAG6_SYNKA|nr:hypothetical protein SKAU_G00008560 [Synaphobranchus kaupii]
MFQRGLGVSGDGPCLGYRKPGEPYQWISYTEVAEQAQVLGSGLLAKGCKPNPQQFISIFAQNKPEWVIAELACYTFSMVVVPLYDTLGLEAMVHILNLAEISLVICDREEKADAALVERGKNCGVEIVPLAQIMELGRQNLKDPVPPKPEDLAVVCFTSGTTGIPHAVTTAFLHYINSKLKTCAEQNDAVSRGSILEGSFVIRQEDVSISYLPLAHMFERMIQVSMFCHGARVGFYQGDISLLMDDIKTLRPTFFPVVPRLLNRIYDKILGSVTSPLRRLVLQYAVRRKQAELSSGVVRNNSLTERERYAFGVPVCFGGYLRDEQRTAEALDSEGWLHSGDVGQWLPNGTLRIIDRKKNIFKLSQGEYIAPEKIENVYTRCVPVLQVFVHGDSLQSHLIGVVVPDPEVFAEWAREQGIVGSYGELCQNPDVQKAVLDDMRAVGKDAGLKSFEQVKDVYLHPEVFSVSNGLLTPTLKSRRVDIRRVFHEQISHMYSKTPV